MADLEQHPEIDLNAFKVGDYVTVRVPILAFEGPTANAMPITIDPNPWIGEIVKHEPANG